MKPPKHLVTSVIVGYLAATAIFTVVWAFDLPSYSRGHALGNALFFFPLIPFVGPEWAVRVLAVWPLTTFAAYLHLSSPKRP